MPKRQQPDQRADNNQGPTMGLQCSEKNPQLAPKYNCVLVQ